MQRFNSNGTSARANVQVALFDCSAGADSYRATILMTRIPDRAAALVLAYSFVYGYRVATGEKTIGNRRP
ncbi:MAG: hypothetical protein LAT63_16170 [Marinobacter sp.]|nr:hypothetical protein [Marinobacter sp.]